MRSRSLALRIVSIAGSRSQSDTDGSIFSQSKAIRCSSKGAEVSRLTDLINQAKAKGSQLGADLEREFKVLFCV